MSALLLLALLLTPAAAQTPQDAKCARYAASWREAQSRFGHAGLADDFVAGQDAFIDSNCRARPGICPRSPQELAMADLMTIGAMNAGMASSFLPFACRG